MSNDDNKVQDTPQEALDGSVPDFQGEDEGLGAYSSTAPQIVSSDSEESGEPKNQDEEPDSTSVDNYFDDDEFLAGDDQTLRSEDDLKIFQQMENVVSWKVANFYKDNGKPRKRISLRNDPPILQISSSDGATAEFFVTNELSASFEKIFGDISKSYRGLDITDNSASAFSQEGIKQKLSSMVDWVSVNRFKAIMLSVVFVLLMVFVIIYS